MTVGSATFLAVGFASYLRLPNSSIASPTRRSYNDVLVYLGLLGLIITRLAALQRPSVHF